MKLYTTLLSISLLSTGTLWSGEDEKNKVLVQEIQKNTAKQNNTFNFINCKTVGATSALATVFCIERAGRDLSNGDYWGFFGHVTTGTITLGVTGVAYLISSKQR